MLASSVGLDLFPWESNVINDWCARDANDRPAYVTCGLAVPRQNGKNAILEAFELYVTAACGWHVLHTAHRVKTAKKSFQRLVRYFNDKRHKALNALVSNIRYTNGEEAIYLSNGGSIEFSARSRAGSRGFDDIQLVIFDEAQDLTNDQLNAVMFTLAASASGERMMVFTGTPPDESSPGDVFARNREVALTSSPKRTCWHEWSVESMPPAGSTFADVEELVYMTNPSMGLVLDIDFTEDEFNKADLLGFAVERLGYWIPRSVQAAAIPTDLWDGAAIDEIGNKYRGKMAFAVKFSPDGSTYALAGCKLGGKGAAVELVEMGTTEGGTKALAQALYERRGRASVVVVDGMSGCDALCDNLSELKAPRGYVVRPRTADVIASSTGLLDELKAGTLKHSVQPALEDSAKGSTRRPIGSRGGWGFGSTETHESTAIEAVALALWGARNTKRNPRRRQVVL